MSRNSCRRDCLELVLQFDRSTKLALWTGNAYSRNSNRVFGQDPLGQYLTGRNRVTLSLFESLTNGGNNGIDGTIFNAYDGRQTAIRLYNYAMLLTQFKNGFCSLVDIWMEFDLIENSSRFSIRNSSRSIKNRVLPDLRRGLPWRFLG